jgi:hypothetical protein
MAFLRSEYFEPGTALSVLGRAARSDPNFSTIGQFNGNRPGGLSY